MADKFLDYEGLDYLLSLFKTKKLDVRLLHSLTIGDKKFDGSENINIEVYNGQMNSENSTVRTYTMTSNNQQNNILTMTK